MIMEKITVRGVHFDNLNFREAVDAAWKIIGESGKARAVFTPNAEIVQMCTEDPDFLNLINSAALILPDGIGVIKASKILGTPLKEKVAGVEFGEALVKGSGENDAGIFFLGGKPGIAETAAEKLKNKYPDALICGTNDGYFDKTGEENERVIEKINGSVAKILFVCLGVPAQEKWINDNSEKLSGVRLCAGLGGSLDVFSGNVKRAPSIVIKLGFEWLYRIVKQPARIKRAAALPKFLIGVYRDKRKIKKQKNK